MKLSEMKQRMRKGYNSFDDRTFLQKIKALRREAAKPREGGGGGWVVPHWDVDEEGPFIVQLIDVFMKQHEALKRIAARPDLPNPERDADWKNCMKWSSAEAREALALVEDK